MNVQKILRAHFWAKMCARARYSKRSWNLGQRTCMHVTKYDNSHSASDSEMIAEDWKIERSRKLWGKLGQVHMLQSLVETWCQCSPQSWCNRCISLHAKFYIISTDPGCLHIFWFANVVTFNIWTRDALSFLGHGTGALLLLLPFLPAAPCLAEELATQSIGGATTATGAGDCPGTLQSADGVVHLCGWWGGGNWQLYTTSAISWLPAQRVLGCMGNPEDVVSDSKWE